ncbi:unnamed protein product [Caenorhabditis auriculariae]|uniref:Pseudouridine synthase n=1 Tax=Caenorhabditis auriculariae TaxID=2777116 RepID=A0A8S1HRL8_9PELO|nr:unnamed protein product [Caenorhabditis auriculariae]
MSEEASQPSTRAQSGGEKKDSKKRTHEKNEKREDEIPIAKRRKHGKDSEEEFPMNVPFKIVDGVRHLSPYWAVYRSHAKGRWIGRKMVDVFSQEFLSTNKNYAKVACKLGRIFVNGVQTVDCDYVMTSRDYIEHYAHRHEHPVRDMPIKVISESDDLLVVDKPPSLPVHACGQYAIHTVLGQLRVNEGRTGLRVLHRLDRTTSGILMFAKNYETDLEFKSTLKQGDWTKEYVCRVEGAFPEEELTCDEPIAPLVLSMGIQCVRKDGKSAHSSFKRLWTDGNESVVLVKITTGRTHQIRVHSQFLGYPIVGDKIYNSTVWGETKGKSAAYGKPFDELCQDVQAAHKSQNWHEKVDPEYEARMEKMASEKLEPEPKNLPKENRPDYDPICLNCNVISKSVPPGHYQLFLHCLRYETEKWSYKTELPDWAVQPSEKVPLVC